MENIFDQQGSKSYPEGLRHCSFSLLISYQHRYCTYLYSDDDVFYLFLQKPKIGAELHVYLEEGTYHKSLFRGPNTNDMKM